MYIFSAPMPFEKEHIDKLVDINNEISKSKITSLYFALPSNCTDTTGFEQLRTMYKIKTDFNYWEKLITYSLEKDFDFVYLLNSPKEITDIEKILEVQLIKLDSLICKLKKLGCNKVRVSNTQLMNYLIINYPELEIYTSTSFEHTKLRQYKLFLEMFPQVKEVVPSFEVNKNFVLLKNLKEQFPNVNVELMVNEGCLSGCPIRTHHNLSLPYLKSSNYSERDLTLTYNLFLKTCNGYFNNNIYECICNSNLIYPWELEEYNKIGIDRFKLVGRNNISFYNGKYMSFYETYLKAIEDYNVIKDMPYKNLNNYVQALDWDITVDEARKRLPNISHFVKNGHLCSSICGSDCNYCFECAKKLEKYMKNKH